MNLTFGTRDDFWTTPSGARVHVPVNLATNSVEVSLEVLESMLVDLGYTKEES